jgi:DUF2075 family protein
MAKTKWETNIITKHPDSFWSKISGKEIDYLSHLKEEDPNTYQNVYTKPKGTIYIYRNSRTGKNYIGQAKNIVERNKQHWAPGKGTDADRFKSGQFDEIIVLRDRLFSKSHAVDYVEKALIECFQTDGGKLNTNHTTGNKVPFDFHEKDNINDKIIIPLWEKVLYPKKWVKIPTLTKVRKNSLFRYSPFKDLTNEQERIVKTIIDNPSTNYLINGGAGTGKTVLVTNIIAGIIEKFPDSRIGVVFDPNWVKYGKQIFNTYTCYNNANIVVGSSSQILKDTFVNGNFDTIVVDESHKLSRKGGKQHGLLNHVYRGKYKDCSSHLEALQMAGNRVILMYDELQAVRPSNIGREDFKRLTANYTKKTLMQQMRIPEDRFNGKNYGVDDYVKGIKYLLYKDTGILKPEDEQFNRDAFNDITESAYFSFYDGSSPLHDAFDFIEGDANGNYDHANNRVLAGMVYDKKRNGSQYVIKYKIGDNKGKKNKDKNGHCKKMHWHEGDLKKTWNSTYITWLNIKDIDKEDQIGCVYAVQGVDLDCAAVLICNDLKVVDGKLCADPNVLNNPNLKFTKKEQEQMGKELTMLILNQYFVLLTRATYKVRVGFWKNKEFLEYMKETLGITKK